MTSTMGGMGFLNSFPMGVWGFRKSQTSVRSSLRRFSWHSCHDSEELRPKSQEVYFTLSPLLVFILTFCVTLLSPLFSCSFFYLDDRPENPLSAFSLLLLHPFDRTRQRQILFSCISVGLLKSTGRTTMVLTLWAQELGLWETMVRWWHSRVLVLSVLLAAVPHSCDLAGHSAAKHLISVWGSWWHSIYLRRLLRG